MKNHYILLLLLFAVSLLTCQQAPKETVATIDVPTSNKYEDLTTLFQEWRTFENPPKRDGAPDYTAETFQKRWPAFKQLQARLLAIDTTGWATPQQVDWHIVWAEINGYDFNHRILKPWARDPAFYKSLWMSRSDVPAHEGPTHHGTTEIWTYDFPLTAETKAKLLADFQVIPALNEQAKLNLTGNAKDLSLIHI